MERWTVQERRNARIWVWMVVWVPRAYATTTRQVRRSAVACMPGAGPSRRGRLEIATAGGKKKGALTVGMAWDGALVLGTWCSDCDCDCEG